MMKKQNNKTGAVLLTVIILSMVLSVIVITIMSANVGQVKSSQSVIDDKKSEYLGQSYFYKYHQEMATTDTSSLAPISDLIIDSKAFSVNISEDSGVNDTTKVLINIFYP